MWAEKHAIYDSEKTALSTAQVSKRLVPKSNTLVDCVSRTTWTGLKSPWTCPWSVISPCASSASIRKRLVLESSTWDLTPRDLCSRALVFSVSSALRSPKAWVRLAADGAKVVATCQRRSKPSGMQHQRSRIGQAPYPSARP